MIIYILLFKDKFQLKSNLAMIQSIHCIASKHVFLQQVSLCNAIRFLWVLLPTNNNMLAIYTFLFWLRNTTFCLHFMQGTSYVIVQQLIWFVILVEINLHYFELLYDHWCIIDIENIFKINKDDLRIFHLFEIFDTDNLTWIIKKLTMQASRPI